MLRVTVEIVPFGIEEEAHVIDQMLVANVGSIGGLAGYEFIQTSKDQRWAGTLSGFDRNWGPWELIRLILDDPDTLVQYMDKEALLLTQAALADRLDSYKEKK